MKLTRTQMMWLVFCINVGLPIYLSGTMNVTKQDAWFSVILAGAAGFIVLALAVRNAKYFPGQTFIEFTQEVLGKWVGRFWVLPYLAFWMISLGNILRSVVDFIIMALFKETPLTAVVIVLFVVVAFAVATNGINTIARCAELMGPLIVLMFLCIYILNLSNLDFTFLLPVAADTSPLNMARGTFTMMEMYGDSYLLVMVFGFLNKQKGVTPKIYVGFTLAVGLMVLTTTFILLTFGPGLAAKMQYPLYELVRYIEVGEFLQRIEVVMIALWVCSAFIKLGFYLFCLSYGTAQWLGIKKWKLLIIPISLLAIWAAGLTTSLLTTRALLLRYIDPVILPLLYFILPVILWIMILLHRRKNQKVQTGVVPTIPKASMGWKWSGVTLLILMLSMYYYMYIRYFKV
ncbi:GerAB/ArcD/ProY family transporter [Paenibacillus agri]|uniref:GerAB/ArcD/ProY family transporter n=1 Tax=Paenibacillus agri TaxID=2744309 RepID=A0A850EHV6_9BACL|nr:endospore germination permease [Paenibacillus agri]NUU60468.1 GerAB/ArcD/ProY family transporter [Paenibacillus agri]